MKPTKPTHTKGPWKVIQRKNSDYFDLVTDETFRAPTFISKISGQNEPNAALIASAPELLNMLEYLWNKLSTDEVQRLESISSGLFKNVEILFNKACGVVDEQ